ncbi:MULTISPECIES: protease modulator HflC [Sphingomonas]|uniref:Protein HflC n=1 Tax=Sphingomonas aerolata TaxID=185951 RepID=A0A2T4YQ08_9SPHN|nr:MULTISPECIES: protease modulator HflC [Sphingomonas]MBD8701325.1 protease modulator HflC [Sphingomonas sp. CFBP 13714]MBD8736377.1 protease modulator HflC [Sphingomonas sp. CFBP 13706]MBP2513343.1 membrane protease subunit HflC [Sphingomonas sp. PvP018]MBB3585240.1 membrane protease subunit HflC [Sphingomonas sp. BK481]MDY1009658.1 protease modulator HflC [Sphingomonas sp. CFBP9019]
MNGLTWRNPLIAGAIALVLVILAAASFAIVPETQQAVILRFGQPIRTVNAYAPGQPFGQTGAGLIARVPFIDRIVWIDKRVQDIELDNTLVLSTDQLRLEVDAYARYRVVDPRKMRNAVGSEERIPDQLRPILGSALRNELGKRRFVELLSPERSELMDNIQTGLQRVASQYGVEIVDVRIKQANLPVGLPLESALKRMSSARQQEAITIRAEGQKQAQIVRAQADADSAKIYAESFGKDADFYDFYRAMQSYRHTFGADGGPAPEGSTSIILSPNNSYLREFEGRGR